jgi:hypothetical protein
MSSLEHNHGCSRKAQAFIGVDAYKEHKARRLRQGDNPKITENQAFVLSDPKTRKLFQDA